MPQAQFAGYFVALEKGLYAAENLDVTILPGGPDIVSEQQVANGQADFGIDWVASFLAFRAGKWEIPMLLALVLTDELNPLIRLYAWQIVMNKEGVLNKFLQAIGVIDEPLTMLFTMTAVIVVLATGSLAFVVIPIYAALKTVNRTLIEAARDLGAGWPTILREVLLPLAATGFIAAIIIVFVPMLSDFASPAVVGGREGYMIASLIEEEFNARGDWGVGSALSFVVLAISALMVWFSIKISKVGRLQA